MESSTLREPADISLGLNDSFIIKRIFLSFFQAFFAQHSKYTWTSSVDTKILILDKYSMDMAPLDKKPAIIVSRGYMRFMGTSIGQKLRQSLYSDNVTYTDLLAGSMTFNCLAKNGLVCEELALTVRNCLIGFRKQLLQNGIHTINSIVVGEESTVRADSDLVLQVVPVQIEFTKQAFIQGIEDFYTTSATLTFSGTNYGNYSGLYYNTSAPYQAFENNEYTVFESGIVFVSGFAPPLGSTVNLRYIDAITLTEQSETPSGTVNGINRTFYTSQEIYGYSPLLGAITLSGITIIAE